MEKQLYACDEIRGVLSTYFTFSNKYVPNKMDVAVKYLDIPNDIYFWTIRVQRVFSITSNAKNIEISVSENEWKQFI